MVVPDSNLTRSAKAAALCLMLASIPASADAYCVDPAYAAKIRHGFPTMRLPVYLSIGQSTDSRARWLPTSMTGSTPRSSATPTRSRATPVPTNTTTAPTGSASSACCRRSAISLNRSTSSGRSTTARRTTSPSRCCTNSVTCSAWSTATSARSLAAPRSPATIPLATMA